MRPEEDTSSTKPILEGDISVIYETYIASITTAEQRRSQVSAIYTAILAASVAGLGFTPEVNLIFPAVSVLFLSTLWASQIKYFESLAGIKWKTALSLERRLVAAPFTDEYDAIKKARLENRHSKRRFSTLEVILPRGLQLVSGAYLLFELVSWLLPGEWRFWETFI